MRRLAGAAVIVLLSSAAAVAQSRPVANLKDLPPVQQVTNVGYCRGEYDVSLGDGNARRFKEYDLAFKTDSSPNGPKPAKPALIPSGRVGDRAFVVFAELEELRRTLKVGRALRRSAARLEERLAAAVPSSNHPAEQAGTADNITKSVEVEWAGCA